MKTRKLESRILPCKASEPFLAEIIPFRVILSLLRYFLRMLFGGTMVMKSS